jgi:hypothetical protein
MKVAFSKTVKIWQRKITSFMNDFKKSTIFWDMTLHSPFEVNRRFGGTYRLNFLIRRINQARNQPEVRWETDDLLTTCLYAGFLFDLLFSPKHGADVDWLSRFARRYISENSTLHNYRNQNLKSYNFRKIHIFKHIDGVSLFVLMSANDLAPQFRFTFHRTIRHNVYYLSRWLKGTIGWTS